MGIDMTKINLHGEWNFQLDKDKQGLNNELYKKEITIGEINLLLFDEIKEPIKVDVKTRYSSKVAKAMIIQNGD